MDTQDGKDWLDCQEQLVTQEHVDGQESLEGQVSSTVFVVSLTAAYSWCQTVCLPVKTIPKLKDALQQIWTASPHN